MQSTSLNRYVWVVLGFKRDEEEWKRDGNSESPDVKRESLKR